jgi:hypothetical protein
LQKNAAVFGKLPVNAMELKTDREANSYKNKAIMFIGLDILLMAILITSLVLFKDPN